ncbi:MAG TPA: uroporphyrinogen-III synthase [Alphaproteobacteria bacterium]|nr:uroporphyrinogen-III synthase [Alphaproteobacteria bacterium]
MRILVTRPREDSERLAQLLEAKGHQVLIEPLFTIEPVLDTPLDLEIVQALLMTSANGVRAFAFRSPRRDLRVFAVGDATAEAARAFGFADVESAGGDVGDLARLVRERARPEDGALLHTAGSATAGDLAGDLQAAGFEVRRAVLYRSEAASALSAELCTALREGRIDLALFFSPRTARTFVSLAKAAGVDRACKDVALIGLSAAVVDAASEIAWAVREAAGAPTEAALLATVDRVAAMHEEHEQARMSAAPEPELQPAPMQTVESAAPAAPDRRGAALAILALALSVAALGWMAWEEFAPRQDASAPRLAALEQRNAAIERDVAARLAAVDQLRTDAERRAAALNERLGTLESRLAALSDAAKGVESRIARLEQEQQTDTDPARLAMLTAESRRLAQELARLQEAFGTLDATLGERSEQRRGDSLVLALGQLRELMGRGAPYASALAAARSLASEDQTVLQQLASIETGAERGVPTRAALRERFDKAATEAVRADRVAGAGGWWRPIAERLSSLVTWRRVDAVQGDDVEAILARAEQRLSADDLAGAIVEVEKLQQPGAAAMQGWLADARARAAADAAMARLTAHVLRPGASAQ